MPEMLNENQMNELDRILAEEDAQRAADEEAQKAAEPEEQTATDTGEANVPTEAEAQAAQEANQQQIDAANAQQAMDEGAAQQAIEEGAQQAAEETQAALPDGINSIEELASKYEELMQREQTRAQDMQALRDMNASLVSIAEALGYTKDVGSVDLNVDEKLKQTDPEAYARGQIRKEVAEQLKPMLEQQQKNLRGRMIDQAWKSFAQEHEDVQDMMDDIREVIGESPELSDNEDGLSIAYTIARAKRYKPEKELMEDEEFINRAAENQKVRDKVIEKYLREVAKSGEGAPASVGNGGRPTPTGKKRPMSMAEAKKGFLKMLGE